MFAQVVSSFEEYDPELYLRVALTSDLHFGEMLSDRSLCKFLKLIDAQKPDLYLNLGDNSHGWNGFDKTNKVLRFEKENLSPSIIRAGFPGNHDFWLRADEIPYAERKRMSFLGRDRPPEGIWHSYVMRMQDTYAAHGCHYFDYDGPLRLKGITFFGATGWYGEDGQFIHAHTHDYSNMPWHVQGMPIHVFHQNRAESNLHRNLDLLKDTDKDLVFCSHFPVVDLNLDSAGRHYSGNPALGKVLREHYGVQTFLNGHEHARHIGPQRFSSGSDYGKPKYLLLAFPRTA